MFGTKSILALALAQCLTAAAPAIIIYVDDSAIGGANDGSSWENAFLDLQDALAVAKADDEIRIGQGVYKPAPSNGSREATFNLISGGVMQGGYAGFGADDPDALDPKTFQTILSGDLNGDDGPPGGFTNYGENSYHVMTIDAGAKGIELRGLVITAGYANGGAPGDIHHMAGGLVCLGEADLMLHECTFIHNQAQIESGAMRSAGGSLHLHSCTFDTNRVVHPTGGPGALHVHDGELIDCTFRYNRAGVQVPAGVGGAVRGSGMLAFSNCVFEHNSGGVGTAVFLNQSTGLFTDCTFESNGGDEGAIYVGHGGQATIRGCTFESNGGCCGGAAISAPFDAITTVVNSQFRGNVGYIGGAISSDGALQVIDCIFTANTTSQGTAGLDTGGGALHNRGSCTLVNCSFLANVSDNHGGAVLNASGATLTAANCLFAANKTPLDSLFHFDGGAVFNHEASATFINCTLVGNQANSHGGGVVNNEGQLTIQNCLLWDNVAGWTNNDEEKQIYLHGGTLTVSNSCIMGWTGALSGDGNHGNDPNFVDADGADGIYGTEDDNPRLLANSPCIEGGDNGALPPDTFDLDDDGDTREPIPSDLDGLPRVVNATVDMGAFEFQGAPCRADIDGDGAVDVDDLITVILTWGACTPGETCPADLNLNMQVEVDDLIAVLLQWGPCR